MSGQISTASTATDLLHSVATVPSTVLSKASLWVAQYRAARLIKRIDQLQNRTACAIDRTVAFRNQAH